MPKIGLYTNSAEIPTNPNYSRGPGISGNSGHCALTSPLQGESPSAYCEAMHALGVKLGLPLSTLTKPAASSGHVGRSGRRQARHASSFTAFINPGSTIAHDRRGTPARDQRHRQEPAGVHQRRRQLRRHQRRRRDRGPRRSGRPTLQRHVEHHGPAHAGLDVRRDVRHDQPGRLGLRPRRLDLPRLHRQPRVRRHHARHGHVGRDATAPRRTRSTATRPTRPRSTARPAVVDQRRTAPATRS